VKPRPGEYVPDSTEGITRVEDLPKPLLGKRSRRHRRRPCPCCGRSCYRDGLGHRTLHALGCLLRDRPRLLLVAYSRHYCPSCKRYFGADLSDLAPPGSHYTQRVISLANAPVGSLMSQLKTLSEGAPAGEGEGQGEAAGG